VSAADAAAAQSAAISTAATDATNKANAAQSAAETTAAADATSKRNDVAQKLGYADWAAMETAATKGETIIEGGYLRTLLIKVENLLAQNITLQANGYIQSSNYTESDGKPTAGFKFDAANNVIKAYGGIYNNVEVTGMITANKGRFNAGIGQNVSLGTYVPTNPNPFKKELSFEGFNTGLFVFYKQEVTTVQRNKTVLCMVIIAPTGRGSYTGATIYDYNGNEYSITFENNKMYFNFQSNSLYDISYTVLKLV
jgi:hypothetical protein